MTPQAHHTLLFGTAYGYVLLVISVFCLFLFLRIATSDAERGKGNLRTVWWALALSIVAALSIPLYPLLATHY